MRNGKLRDALSGWRPSVPLMLGILDIVLLAVMLAGCGGSPQPNEVEMGVAAFQQSTISIKAGQAVHFVNPASGGTHVICVGQDLKCTAQAGAPAELNTADGMTFQTGDTHDIVFPTAGTYNVICIIHPGMEVVVTVT
jgi:plastocyanin